MLAAPASGLTVACMLLGVLSAAALAARNAPPLAAFVVAAGGDDAGPGTTEEPFATVAGAQQAVRERVKAGLKADLNVLVRGGTYRIEEPLVFGPQDGGTDDHAVTWAAWPGETPVISGGRPVTGWTEEPDGTWTAEAPEAKGGRRQFRELFVNGHRATRARHSNDGCLRVAEVGPDRRTSFTFREGDVKSWPDAEQVELVFFHDWSLSRVRIASVDETSRTVTLAHPVGPHAKHFAMDWFEPHPRYFLENSAAFLDAPGEWHLDAASGVVRYRPRPGERIETVEAIAPVATHLLEVRGDTKTGRPVRNLHFRGLVFEHCGWSLPPEGYAAGQACFHERRDGGPKGALRNFIPAALLFDLAEDCTVEDATVRHLGGSGLWFRRTCRRCALVGSVVEDVSGNGAMIGEDGSRRVEGRQWWRSAAGEVAGGNRIEHCLIERCGQQFYGAVGVWVGLAEETQIVRSEIRDLPYTGISVGWAWNPTPTPCRASRVARCHIHHVMQILSDGGGIYTLGRQPGTVLAENVIHDVPRNAGLAESNGMFLDEGTTGILVDENVIFGVDRSPLRWHRCGENTSRANLLVVPEGVPPHRYNATPPENVEKVDETVVEEGDVRQALEQRIKVARDRAGRPADYPE
jgi:hypothetical protein